MAEMTPDEMIEKLVENVIMYGTGFTKITRDPQGGLQTSIVPFEDYQYIKREWVGLTRDEINKCQFDAINGTVWSTDVDLDEYTRLIEAKLKEKNT